MTTTPEELKAVAEYMGYEPDILDKGLPCESVYIRTKHNFPENLRYLENAYEYRIEYNPLTNPEQDRELEIKGKIRTAYRVESNGWEAAIFKSKDNYYGYGKTPTDARIKAVLEMLRSEK